VFTKRVTAHSGTVGSYFGFSVSLEGDTAVVGAPGWGEVFTYLHDGVNWQVGPRIPDPVWGSGRSFGRAVAFQGGRLVVGTPGDSERRAGAGACYVYLQTLTSAWVADGKLLPPATNPAQKLTGAYYGSTVGISGDLLVMGGPQADIAGDQNGAVAVFLRQNNTWIYQSTLSATGSGSYDYLATGLDIDGTAVLAGAPGHDARGTDVGAAYRFVIETDDNPGDDDPPDEDAPPPNQSPTASFVFTTDALTAHFDGSGSSDADGYIAAYSWDFGDGAKGNGAKISHTYVYAGTYTVRLTVADDDGALGTTTRSVTVSGDSPIVLTATGYKLSGLQKANLAWKGTAAAKVEVYRNGARVAVVNNTGAYTDHIDKRGRGTYTYRICEPDTGKCSNDATIVFD
jgi:PKD repeat protein